MIEAVVEQTERIDGEGSLMVEDLDEREADDA